MRSSCVLKVFAYLTKKEGLETQAFIDYYENHHVPLILSLNDRSPGLQTQLRRAR